MIDADTPVPARRLAFLRRLPPHHPSNGSRRVRLAEALAWRAFDSRSLSCLHRREHVLCLGDSHLAALSQVSLPGVWFRILALGGATASGIQNPASRTGARRLFEARLALARDWQHLLLGLGEVDCGFVIWHRARAHDLDVSVQLRDTLDKYSAFIAAVVGLGVRSVSVLSASFPTVARYAEARGNPGLRMRSAIEVPLSDRIALTHSYNAELGRRCQALGATFFDTTADQLDPSTGLVRSELAVKDDPHLEPAAYAQILAGALGTARAPWYALT